MSTPRPNPELKTRLERQADLVHATNSKEEAVSSPAKRQQNQEQSDVLPPPADAECASLPASAVQHGGDVPAIHIYQRVRRPNGELSPWQNVVAIPLASIPGIKSTEYLEVVWAIDRPQGSGPSSDIRLSPPLRIRPVDKEDQP